MSLMRDDVSALAKGSANAIVKFLRDIVSSVEAGMKGKKGPHADSSQQNEIGDRIVGSVTGYVDRCSDAIMQRVGGLDARIKALEARPQMQYRGVWEFGTSYAEGSFVTDGGSMWHARVETTSRPGTDSTWALAVKRGRDAK